MYSINIRDYEELPGRINGKEVCMKILIDELKEKSDGGKILVLTYGNEILSYMVPLKIVQLLVTQYVAKELITVEVNDSDLSDK